MVLFFSLISVVVLNDQIHFTSPPKVLAVERRNISSEPQLDINHLDLYPEAYSRYYDDYFPYRLNLINFYAGNVCLKFFHRSPYPDKVDLGRDGWLYFAEEGAMYKGTYKLEDAHIKSIVAELHKRALYYHEKGIKFYLAIPPLKQEIYPEHLPLKYSKLPGLNVTEKVIDLIRKDPLVNFIDLKSALINAKKHGRLYFKTDNHWNSLGGYYGYRSIIERIKKDFPSIIPLDTNDFTMKMKVINGANIAQFINISEYIKDESTDHTVKVERASYEKPKGYKAPAALLHPQEFEVVRRVKNPSLPTIVIVRDSYFYGLMPYIIENFKKSITLYDSRTYEIYDEVTRNEKPDLVLYMIYEPRLVCLIGLNRW